MRTPLILTAIGGFVIACGDLLEKEPEPMAGPITVQLDIADEVAIGELSQAQRDETCMALNTAVEDGVPATEMCDVAGLVAAAGKSMEGLDAARATCDEVVEPCRLGARLGGQVDAPSLPIECALFRGDTETCTSTVGDLEVCLGHLATATAASIIALSCATLSADGLAEAGSTVVGEGVPDDPTCVRIAAECPGVFGSGEPAMDAGAPEGDASLPPG